MRVRTLAVLGLVVLSLATVLGASLMAGEQVALEETWVSDTARENRVNHHAVGVGPDGDVFAPVAAVVDTETMGPTSCSLVRLSASDGGVRWRGPVPPANCTTHAITAPAFGDLDDDPGVETAVATTEDALVVRDASTGDESWRVSLPAYGYGRPVVADLTAAPGAEVAMSTIGGNVTVANRGAVEWRATVDGTVWAPPVVADVDADDDPEVVVGSNHEVVAFERDGGVAWRADVGASTMTSGRVDGDEAVELVAADQGTVRVLDGATGATERQWNASVTARVGDLADGDGDGTPEAYLGLAGGDVIALDLAEERVAWRTTVTETEQMTPAPRVADVTGDGSPEVVAASNDGTVAVLGPQNGEQRATYARDVLVWTKPTVADVDGDDAAEVFVRYGDGRVVRLDGTDG